MATLGINVLSPHKQFPNVFERHYMNLTISLLNQDSDLLPHFYNQYLKFFCKFLYYYHIYCLPLSKSTIMRVLPDHFDNFVDLGLLYLGLLYFFSLKI